MEALNPTEDPAEWNDVKNARRCDLIDKEIEGSLSDSERQELASLQHQAIAYRDRVAPLPIEGARKKYNELLRKQREAGQTERME